MKGKRFSVTILFISIQLLIPWITMSAHDLYAYVSPGNFYQQGELSVNVINIPDTTAPVELDVYTPSVADTYPVVIFIHGFSGSITGYENISTQLASHGFVVILPQMYVGTAPTPEDEALLGVQIISWVETNINNHLSVTADTNLLGLAGHSRGGQTAYRMTLQVPQKVDALAGVDPVDGLEIFGQSVVITGPLTFDIPTYILGTGLGPIIVDEFLACAPEEIGPIHFYCANPDPTWLATATTHGHADMIDEEDFSEFCPGGPDRDGMRAFTGGTLAAFFSGILQGNVSALSVLSDPVAAPVPAEMEMNRMGDACDADQDAVPDGLDNCPNTPNPEQTDSYPFGGNDCGDACECEGNFNPDVDDDVDGSDAAIFKAAFGRGGYNNPCESGNPCNGDFDCDTDVDGTDAAVFKADFGRGGYNSPCPTCTQGDWCSDYSLSSGCGSEIGSSTGERIIMSQDVERVYYLKLPDDYNPLTTYPLIFAFHGLGGDYTLWTEGYYDLQDVVGEEAILVYPNALLINNVPQWNYDTDPVFFDDLYADLEANLCFDIRKVFAVGHSNGAGMSHTLGCKRGNILRAIGPVAGSLTDYGDLIGQVAVMQIHGSNDNIFPVESIRPTRDYWIAINGCNTEEPEEGVHPTCEAYIDCDANFPVQYCEHSGGHEWPDFASSAIWGFFQNLLPVAPSDETGSGDIGNLDNGTISFQIHYPSDFVGTPYKLALALYPYDSTQPFAGSPLYFLNLDIPVGDYIFGEVTEYDNVEITLLGVEYGDYTLTVVVYIEGSSYPMPSDGIDYIGLQNFTLVSDTIEVTTPFELELVEW